MIIKTFTLNEGSGGGGRYKGGDGVLRDFLFRRPLTLSVLSERRVLSPYGMEGSLDWLDNKRKIFSSKDFLKRIKIETFTYIISNIKSNS